VQSVRSPRGRIALGSRFAGAVIAAALAGCLHAQEPREAKIDRMHEACVTAMVKSSCQVMAGTSPPATASAVVIAGVGQIDAQAYRALREAGDAMCGIAKSACVKDWEGGSCRSARALWSAELAQAR
jgi:hypothetical protein